MPWRREAFSDSRLSVVHEAELLIGGCALDNTIQGGVSG